MRKFRFLCLVVALLTAGSVMAATEQQKQVSINDGLAWLASTQTVSGSEGYWSYSNDGTLAATAAAALAFVEEGQWHPESTYYDVTSRALRYIFNRAAIDDRFGVETAVYQRYAEDYNNDGNYDNDGGNDQAIYFNPGNNQRNVYTTGICIPVVYALGEALGRNTVIGFGSAAISGKTYAQAMQDLIDWFCWGQVEPNLGNYRGGWRYDANYSSSDNSTAQWGALPQLYASSWGLGAPQYVKNELALWADYIQNDASGGSGYDSPTSLVNISKTGGLLLEFAAIGRDFSHASVQAALGYISTHWNEGVSGWDGNLNNPYAMWALYKALHVYGLTGYLFYGPEPDDDVMFGYGVPSAPGGFTIGQDYDPVISAVGDWYSHYCDYLVGIQNADGSWSGAESWTGPLATGWYINIINATGYVPPPCVEAAVEAPSYAEGHLTVPISLASVEGKEPITGIDLVFGYDPAVLEPTGVTFDGTLLDGLGWGHMYNVPIPGEVRVGLAGTTPIPGDGILIYLEFDIAETAPCNGETPLDLFLLLNEGDPCVNYSPESDTSWTMPLAELTGTVNFWGCGMVGNTNPPIPDVMVEVSSSWYADTAFTDSQGIFLLEACLDSCYTIEPSKPCGETEGISPFDAALVLRYFVGLEDLDECPIEPMEMYDGTYCPDDDVYPQLVAADVSNNGSIHSFDASIILKYVVGEDLPLEYLVGCWDFYCEDRDLCVEEDVTEDLDFVGLLYGDVSGNYGLTFPRFVPGNSVAGIAVGVVSAEVGQTVEVPVLLTRADGYFGLDFTITHVPEMVSVEGVIASSMASECLMEWHAEAGQVHIAAASMNGFIGDGEFCRIVYSVHELPEGQSCLLDLVYARADERPELMGMSDGRIVPGEATGVEDGLPMPSAFHLSAPVPNPFNPLTTIGFALPKASHVTLSVHDVSGRQIMVLADGWFDPGEFTRTWDGKDSGGLTVSSGVYFARMAAGDFAATKKMVLLR